MRPVPLATVVIPTHNRSALLRDAVTSSLRQVGVSVQIVVVDDASSDDTAAWLANVDDPRVDSVRFETHQERTIARNAGLARVSTPYVLFLDDDDVLTPDALEQLAQALDRYPDAPLAAGTYATFGTYGPKEVPRQPTIGRRTRCRSMSLELLWGWYVLPGMALWRTDFLRAIGGWDESRSFAEDLELCLRVHPHPMVLIPRVVLRYRQHGRQIDPATELRRERMNDEVRRTFVARLTPREQRRAQRVLEARPTFTEALDAYADGHYRSAGVGLVRAVWAAPAVLRSPVLAPMFASMIAKSGMALAVPAPVRRRVRLNRQARRAERFGAHAA